jgi:hypothetical protein
VRFGEGHPQPVLVVQRYDQVDMIEHRAISLDLRAGTPRRRRDQPTVQPIIAGPEEHRLTTIAALGDMMWQPRHNHARNPGHCRSLQLPSSLIEIKKLR